MRTVRLYESASSKERRCIFFAGESADQINPLPDSPEQAEHAPEQSEIADEEVENVEDTVEQESELAEREIQKNDQKNKEAINKQSTNLRQEAEKNPDQAVPLNEVAEKLDNSAASDDASAPPESNVETEGPSPKQDLENTQAWKMLEGIGMPQEALKRTVAAIAQLDRTEQLQLLGSSQDLLKKLGPDGVENVVAFYKASSREEQDRAYASMTREQMNAVGEFTGSPVYKKFAEYQRTMTPDNVDDTLNKLGEGIESFMEKLAPFLEAIGKFMQQFNEIMERMKKKWETARTGVDPDALPATKEAEIDDQIDRGLHLEKHKEATEQQLASVDEKLDAFDGNSQSEKKKKLKEQRTDTSDKIAGMQTSLRGDLESDERKNLTGQLEALEEFQKDLKNKEKEIDSLYEQKEKLEKRLQAIEGKQEDEPKTEDVEAEAEPEKEQKDSQENKESEALSSKAPDVRDIEAAEKFIEEQMEKVQKGENTMQVIAALEDYVEKLESGITLEKDDPWFRPEDVDRSRLANKIREFVKSAEEESSPDVNAAT